MSSNGRPGTRQGSRTPHRGAALPVDAYSLAVSCGGRGVSLDIWPASLSALSVSRVVRLSRHDRDRSPSRTIRRATTWSRHAGPLARQARGPSRALAALLAVVVRLRPRATANVAYGALRCVVDRLCCCVAAGTGAALALLSHAGLFVPATSPVATDVCGAPYHRVITLASTILLAQPLARLAWRPILGPVTTAIAPPGDVPRRAPSAASGSPQR